jgi:hypothetical protein
MAPVKISSGGVHDVYFVFKNQKTLSTQIMMQVLGIDFKSGAN